MKRKILSVLLVAAMVLTMLPGMALAMEYNDTAGHWAEDAIERWTDAGVVRGNQGSFAPNKNMTRAEAAKTIENLLRLTEKADLSTYMDVELDAWYADAMARCAAEGILKGLGGGRMGPDESISREMLFVMAARALGIKEQAASQKTFSDSQKIDSWAEGYINALADMGAIKGVGDNKLAPLDDIDRASVMTVLNNMIGTYANKDGQWEIAESGITLIVAENVTLKGEANGLPTVLSGDAAKVDMKDVTGAAKVIVKADGLTITNAPAGTEFITEGAENVAVNGHEMSANDDYIIPAPTTPDPGPAGPSPSTPADTYSVTVTASENGKVTASAASAAEGATITLTIEPATGYELKTLTVKSGETEIATVKGEDGKYTFTMPAGSVNVTAAFEKMTLTVSFDANGGSFDPGNCESDPGNCEGEDNDTSGGEGNTDPGNCESDPGNCEGEDNDTSGGEGNTDPGNCESDPGNCEGDDNNTGGSGGSTESSATLKQVQVAYGSAIGENMPQAPVLDGRVFLGWSTVQGASEPDFDKDTVVTASITVYAVWKDPDNCESNPGNCEGEDNDTSGGEDNTDPDNCESNPGNCEGEDNDTSGENQDTKKP